MTSRLKYRFLVYPSFEHQIIVTNSLPNRLEFKFFSRIPSESWLMRLFVVDPTALDVFAGQTKVNASITARPTAADVDGTNQFDPQARFLWLTQRGGQAGSGSGGSVYMIATTPMVQLSLRLAVGIEDFYSTGIVANIATLLNVRGFPSSGVGGNCYIFNSVFLFQRWT